ncbi:hypothetical protein [Streptomyces spiramenti]|uniref:SRPBCC family protein n=1 Tax=Streptomyces spiramenti TaxID=2720606 RepID=A0ABX1AVA4_9ACTN|nr:hypothetical protein [Streptomyces spiramenti]NJP68748.1 hypothetical protein [Streptomyces spiramenti]
MNEQQSVRRLAGSRDATRAILLDPGALPEWNPAITGLTLPPVVGTSRERPTVGHRYPVTGVRGLRGHLSYTGIDEDRITMRISLNGLTEDNWWTLVEADGDAPATLVGHGISHRGPLALLLSAAFRGVCDLRLDRLAARLRTAGHPC